MKKILILGAGEFNIPVVKQAKRMGLYTIVMDINENSVAIPYADEYIHCSLRDIDEVIKVAKEIKPDGITTGASDVGVMAASRASTELGIPGLSLDVAKRATNKYLMRDSFIDHNVPCPKYKYISKEELDDMKNTNRLININLSYPVISKPVDMSGSRGIQLSRNEEELKRALFDSSNTGCTGNILVEEFMEGPEVSVELVIKNSEPTVLQITDKMTTGAPHFIEYGHTQPTSLPTDIADKIKKVAIGSAKALGIVNGIGHAEIIVTKEGPKMVEIGARMGGDSIQEQLIELSCGINVAEVSLKIALGEDFEVPTPAFHKGSAIRFLLSSSGIVKSISGFDDVLKMNGVKYATLQCKVGDNKNDAVDNSGRLAYVIAQGNDALEASTLCEKALNNIKIIVD